MPLLEGKVWKLQFPSLKTTPSFEHYKLYTLPCPKCSTFLGLLSFGHIQGTHSWKSEETFIRKSLQIPWIDLYIQSSKKSYKVLDTSFFRSLTCNFDPTLGTSFGTYTYKRPWNVLHSPKKLRIIMLYSSGSFHTIGESISIFEKSQNQQIVYIKKIIPQN